MKELYDRVRTAVDNALTALSKQYEAEMEQQAGRVGTLQEQVQRSRDLKPQLGRTEALAEDLKQQVKRLAVDPSRRSFGYENGAPLGADPRRVCDRSGFDGPSYAVETMLRLTDRPL